LQSCIEAIGRAMAVCKVTGAEKEVMVSVAVFLPVVFFFSWVNVIIVSHIDDLPSLQVVASDFYTCLVQ